MLFFGSAEPAGYTCLPMEDIAGKSCDIKGVHSHGNSLPALAALDLSGNGLRDLRPPSRREHSRPVHAEVPMFGRGLCWD